MLFRSGFENFPEGEIAPKAEMCQIGPKCTKSMSTGVLLCVELKKHLENDVSHRKRAFLYRFVPKIFFVHLPLLAEIGLGTGNSDQIKMFEGHI